MKLPHPTRACLGGWVQKLLPPALLSGHFPLHSVAPFILLGCCPPVTAISLQMPSYCHRLPSSCCTPTSGMFRTAAHPPLVSLPYIGVRHSSLLLRYKPVVLSGGLCVSWRGNVMNIVCSNRQLGESSAGDCC